MRSSTKILLTTLCSLLGTLTMLATHYRAGEVTIQHVENLTFRAIVYTYTTVGSLADKDFVEIEWEDGKIDTIYRTNGPDNNGNGIPDGVVLGNNIQQNIFIGFHTYPGVPPPPNRFYVVRFFDPNRIDGINNIDNGNSVNIPFYVEDTLRFPADPSIIGFNSTPILLNPPIDFANRGDTFWHNPAAYDPDGLDSLDFELITPLQKQGLDVPFYLLPDVYCGGGNVFTLNRFTGEIMWAVPCQVGVFNIAILIREYRRGVLLSTTIRDMQIIVLNEPNDPPQITDVPDTCIRAGDTLRVTVTARDNNPSQTVRITATGGPFVTSSSPATFSAVNGNPATGVFNWNTTCSHIQRQPYTIVFKAEDNYQIPGPSGPTPAPLVDIETWQVRVIAPPVENLTATTTNSSVILNWQNPYKCAGDPKFRRFSVWRKIGCDPFEPDYCETGLAGRGYTKIADSLLTYTYTDNTALVGQQYSYRVLAHFANLSPNGFFELDATESVPSNEVCVFRPISVPVILNVDIEETSETNGRIFVRWSKPLAGGTNLDTIQNPPPYRFDVYRGNGFNFASPQLMQSYTANSFATLNDTTFTDTGMDTKNSPWSYKVMFYSNNDTVGSTSIASSVYLNINASDQSLSLSWNENVPWSNDSFVVYRLNNTTSIYDSLATVYNRQYIDTGLQNDTTYCYYVKAYGHYSVNFLPKPLINKSQIDCEVPVDTLPPCPPILQATNDCSIYESNVWPDPVFINYLKWKITDEPCNEDIYSYKIYYSTDSNALTLLTTISVVGDTTYNHTLPDNLAGCYAITAVDRLGNESAFSNIVCVDNCPYYILPNTFTPNGDGQNDVFHPFKPYRFVTRIDMRIYNRWGVEVFRTNDPEIGWNGKDQKTGKDLPDGVYLYAGQYYENRLGGEVAKPLNSDKKGGGVIHLIRGK